MKQTKGALIDSIEPGSIAQELEIEKGDTVLFINNNEIVDYLDYKFLSSSEEIVLTIKKASGEIIEYEIYNECGEDLGINFADMLFGSAKRCVNKCIFCFIDQLPEGMRSTMYFKDDDTRLSFLHGNYVTLTNMKKKDIEKLIRYRISPVNISVHTTNPDLREKMLSNPNAREILEQIKMLYDGRIEMNMQIVLLKGINDGEELINSLETLSGFYPYVRSISVVPVGLTKWRDGRACFGSIYTKTRTIQRLAWPLSKDDVKIHECFHSFRGKGHMYTFG